jgi:hypothetical protein
MRSVTIVLVAAAIGSACSAQRRLTERDVVGRFVYHSEDPGDRRSDHERDAIVLNADHTYVLTTGGSTKAVALRMGRWKFADSTPTNQGGPEVVLETQGYPVRRSFPRGIVRLGIDDDTGIWFEKVK